MKTSDKHIVISGLSGSGKSTAVKIFEDLGYYCVDNIPCALLPTFVELCQRAEEGPLKGVMCVDVRERQFLREFPRLYASLRRRFAMELLFFESSKPVLLRRFSETRRRHPLAMDGPLSRGIALEVEAMRPIRKLADRVIDTSDMNVHDLKKLILATYRGGEKGRITLSLTSFGYRYGLPLESDMVFDVRFLPNPHFSKDLRRFTGKNATVRRYIFGFAQSREFLDLVENLMLYIIPHAISEGKSYLNIALGCTGGRHRSVAMAEELRRHLARRGFAVEVNHRDIHKETS